VTPRAIGDYVQDILDAVDAAIQFVEGMTFTEFESDKKTIFATTRAIQIIGEAAKKIPDSLKVQYPEIPWKGMTGMRDKVTHEYFGVKLDVLWNTIQQDLPKVKDLMPMVLANLAEDE
jgi:uncharacterized protein with HEPN domain